MSYYAFFCGSSNTNNFPFLFVLLPAYMVTNFNTTAARPQKRRCVADCLYGAFPDDALLAIDTVSEIETRDLPPADRCFEDETSLSLALEAYVAYVDDASPAAEAERIRLRHRRG